MSTLEIVLLVLCFVLFVAGFLFGYKEGLTDGVVNVRKRLLKECCARYEVVEETGKRYLVFARLPGSEEYNKRRTYSEWVD